MPTRQFSEEHKRKLREAKLGKKRGKHSEETKIKMRMKALGRKMSLESRNKMSLAKKGKKGNSFTPEQRRVLSEKAKIRSASPEWRKMMSDRAKGEKSSLWRGGLTSKNCTIRNSFEYRLWRSAVFERDSWTCIWCRKRGGKLEADHIKPFCFYPELRFAIDNGRTLCRDCHKKTDTYGSKINNYKMTNK